MAARRLNSRHVERIWGRRGLPEAFAPAVAGAGPIGEIWFEDSGAPDSELLVKYLFTSDKLSVQVHPGDDAARARGYPRGKDEAWLIVDAEPGAAIGLGLREPCTREALRAAALDGTIEDLLDMRPVAAGDALYSPAGTVHAIGPGLVLLEVQQNLDLTYRLYDYGRPRELHLDEAVAVADLGPWRGGCAPEPLDEGREILCRGPALTLERWRGPLDVALDGDAHRDPHVLPLAGGVRIGGADAPGGSAWRISGRERVRLDPGGELVLAYAA